jgi:plastocyanin
MCLNKNYILLLVFGLLSIKTKGQAVNNAVKTIQMKVETGLQFDVVRFNVKPGQAVKIVFENTDDMDHNMLITKPGAREEVVMAALNLGEKGPELNYIPKSDKVLWSVPVISPHQKKTIEFIAPNEPGVYPYVCTYPGHGFVMYGAMYVNATGKMPVLEKDMNIPPNRRGAEMSDGEKHDDMHAGHKMPVSPKPLHPYKPVAPYLYRVFIAGASPAAIAVSLPDDLSYCWDAGTCRLRFAWKGGFLDNSELWKGKGDVLAKVVGKIYFRDNAFPFRLAENGKEPVIAYKGYKLINRYPEFHYTIDGMSVYEMIKPSHNKNGLIRTFRIPKANKTVWFFTDEKDGVKYASSKGKWTKNKLKLTATEAKGFTITLTAKEGAEL